MSRLRRKIESHREGKIIFTDLFDTLLHRTVHPNYTQKLWAKFMVRELGLFTDVDTLFSVRPAVVSHLAQEHGLRGVEVDYYDVIAEVYRRLNNTNLLKDVPYEHFEKMFQRADFVAETAVQFTNETQIANLIHFKNKGYHIYLVTDFYLPKELISQMLEFHGIASLFEDVFVSCSLGKCKENGSIYPYILSHTSTDAADAIMMGDNKKSDVQKAEKHGITAFHLKHISHKFRNRKNLFGDDIKHFGKICKKWERKCRKSPHPYSEYVLHFYFFAERLYLKARQDGIKNLFFLAREGFFLKRLFDAYQEMNRFADDRKISTHYLKMSRHSAVQISLKPLPEEDFSAFKGSLGTISVYDYLDGMAFPEEIKDVIIDDLRHLGEVSQDPDSNFFESETMSRLRQNETFADQYEKHRTTQKRAFEAYLDSFGVDLDAEGLHLVDVGWGGTMQENLYHYLGRKIPVTGYYLGLKEIYNILPDTKRYGLNFSVYPSRDFSDEVLMANGQLYEQLLSAPHGSTLRYTLEDPESFAVTYHKEQEKQAYENWVRPVQEYMFDRFKDIFESLRPIDYSQDTAQDYLVDMALRTGILGNKKHIQFVDNLSKGFYQNVGQNQVGVAYSPTQIKGSKMGLLFSFIKSPEKLFRYLVKVKPWLYSKGLYRLSWPLHLTYYYIRFNFWLKKKWFPKGLVP
ncbi:MAG: HAD hydrolase-like protein [Pricia sp.]